MANKIPIPANVLVVHAEADNRFFTSLAGHLRAMERDGLIEVHSSRSSEPSQLIAGSIAQKLLRANIILPLVSADLVNSEECWSQVCRALERRDAGEALVLPIKVRAAVLPDTKLAEIDALPGEGLTIGEGAESDHAWVAVAEGLRKLLKTGAVTTGRIRGERSFTALPSEPSTARRSAVPPSWISQLAILLGAVGCAGLLMIAQSVPNPSDFQYVVFRTLLSLSGSAFSVALTSMLTVRVPLPSKGYVVGGGSMVIFAALYFSSPHILPSRVPERHAEPVPTSSAPLPDDIGSAPTELPSARGAPLPSGALGEKSQRLKQKASAPAEGLPSAQPANGRCKPGTITRNIGADRPIDLCGTPTEAAIRVEGELHWSNQPDGPDGGRTLVNCHCEAAD